MAFSCIRLYVYFEFLSVFVCLLRVSSYDGISFSLCIYHTKHSYRTYINTYFVAFLCSFTQFHFIHVRIDASICCAMQLIINTRHENNTCLQQDKTFALSLHKIISIVCFSLQFADYVNS